MDVGCSPFYTFKVIGRIFCFCDQREQNQGEKFEMLEFENLTLQEIQET